MTFRRLLLPALVLLCSAVATLRLNDLSLYTDSTRYLLWARSLSMGHGWMDDSQPTPEAYVVNAPLYSLFLAPTQWTGGDPMTSAKIATIIAGFTGLFLFGLWFRKTFGESTALVLTALLATLPMSLVLFSEVLSEGVFLLIMGAILLILHKTPPDGSRDWSFGVLCLLLGVLPLVREVGFALVLSATIILALRRNYRDAAFVLGSALVFFGVWTLRNLLVVGPPVASQAPNVQFIFQRVLSSPDEPFLTEVWRRFGANFAGYRYEFGGMMLFPIPFPLIQSPSGPFRAMFDLLQTIKPWLFILFLPSVAAGAWLSAKKDPQGLLLSLFVAIYLLIVLAYPVQDIRFLFPLVPFVFFWMARAYTTWIEHSGTPARVVAGIWVVLLAGVNLLTNYEVLQTNQSYRSAVSEAGKTGATFEGKGFFGTPWELAGSWVVEHTDSNAVIAASAKEIAPFVRGRKVLEVNKAVPRPMFEEMLRDHDVSMLITTNLQPGHVAHAYNMSEAGRYRFKHLATFGSLHVYRVEPVLPFRAPETAESGLVPGSSEGLTVLDSCRRLILQGSYGDADSLLLTILDAQPSNAEAAFQRVVATALSGRAGEARAAQQALFRTPRSTSYLSVGGILIDIAERIDALDAGMSPEAQTVALFITARSCWDLGYERAALECLDRALTIRPGDFESATWRAHFAMVKGDLSRASQLVRLLERSDADHPTVQRLGEIHAALRRLSSSSAPHERAHLYAEISAAYEAIDLSSDAIDAALAALRISGSDTDRARVAQLYGRTGRTFAAERFAGGPR